MKPYFSKPAFPQHELSLQLEKTKDKPQNFQTWKKT